MRLGDKPLIVLTRGIKEANHAGSPEGATRLSRRGRNYKLIRHVVQRAGNRSSRRRAVTTSSLTNPTSS
jgi:hypothetical protein